MAETLTELVAKITTDATELKKGLDEATHGVQSWVEKNSKQFKAVGIALTGVGAAITGSLGMMTKAAIDEEINIKRLATTMGNMGLSYDDVKDSLEAVISVTQRKTGIADDEQRTALARLLVITDDYEKSLSLLPDVLNLAAFGEMDVTTAATYLGKAFLDLENGAEQVGIRFGQSTVQFKNMEEIQAKLRNQAENLANPLNILKASMGDMAEKIGSFLIPVLKSVVDKVVPIIEKVQAWIDEHPVLTKQLLILAAVIGGFALVLGPILIMLPMLITSFTLLLGPIGLVVGAIVALIAIGTLIVMNWDWIKTKASEIWNGIANFFVGIWDWIKNIFSEHWDKILAILFPAIGLPILIARNWGAIVDVIKDIWNRAIEWFKGVPAKLGAIFATVKDWILAPFRAALSGIEQGINWLIRQLNKISFTIPDWVPIIGGKFFGINIAEVSLPSFARGGIVTQPTLAMIGEAGAEAVVPLNEAGGIGGITINFTQPVFFDREDTMNKFVDMIRKGIQRQDRLRFGGAYSG